MGANATMTNEQATRLGGQRAKFSESFNGKGAGGVLTEIFSSPHAPSSANFAESKSTFDNDSVGRGRNVDFEYDVDLTYLSGEDLYSAVTSQEDKPNEKGPQLKTIKIGDNGQPDITNSDLQEDSGRVSYIGNDRGFGVSPEDRELPNRYNKRDDVTLGEYIDSGSYSWAKPNS